MGGFCTPLQDTDSSAPRVGRIFNHQISPTQGSEFHKVLDTLVEWEEVMSAFPQVPGYSALAPVHKGWCPQTDWEGSGHESPKSAGLIAVERHRSQ